MCVHNFMLHNGCGHKTPFAGSREYTLCAAARSRLPNASPLRTPAGPPPLPPKDSQHQRSPSAAANNNAATRSSTSALRIPQFLSSLGRSASTSARFSPQKRPSRLQRLSSQAARHGRAYSAALSGNPTTTTGTPAADGADDALAVAVASSHPHMSPFEEYVTVWSRADLEAALCGPGDDADADADGDGAGGGGGGRMKVFERREEGVDVCERCRTVINEMRWLVRAYDEKRNIKGCRAYWYVDVPRPGEGSGEDGADGERGWGKEREWETPAAKVGRKEKGKAVARA